MVVLVSMAGSEASTEDPIRRPTRRCSKPLLSLIRSLRSCRESTSLVAASMAQMDVSPDQSDGDMGSDALNSSQSQSSISSTGSFDRCSSLSRLSFDAAAAAQPNVPSTYSSARAARRPHRSSDPAWAAIVSRRQQLGPRDFKLVRRIGSGDIGTVYLCRLRDEQASTKCSYAMKVVNRQLVAKKKKLERAETEKRILSLLDHPFLPTLYAQFDASPNYSCVVTEYCSGGDLHSLRHRQPGRRFTAVSARFYAAEVLVALEYLHMLGIVYRDLKPENILIRSDGHIMLSDFDLSLQSTTSPVLEDIETNAPSSSCLHRGAASSRRFVAEPVAARSTSFVGTHEYVAPEVAAGRAHGSAVDWWAYGVLLYELIYGRTPFAGPTNEATLRSIVRKPLAFPLPPPRAGSTDAAARDLIAGLLEKDPAARLGSRRGAADVREHRFFRGVNLALMRCCRPPVVPAELGRVSSCREKTKPDRFEFF